MYDVAYPSHRPVRAQPRIRGRYILGLLLAGSVVVIGRHWPDDAASGARNTITQTAQLRSDADVAGDDAAEVSYREVDDLDPAPLGRSDMAALFDPNPILGADPQHLSLDAPVNPGFRVAAKPTATATIVARAPQADRFAAPEPQRTAAVSVPLPVRRPTELAATDTTRQAERDNAARMRLAARDTARKAEENESFFDTVFGTKRSDGAALAYAPIENDAISSSPRRRLGLGPLADSEQGTATYDITAQRVYLPNGEVLEAHSGLGPAQDNPDGVHLKMRGATPPGTYYLTEREALFHGVRAIRLNPVGGPQSIHNRVGLLAHTYMLGPKGASNGCISFKNYNRFLQAFLRGEVRRVVVIAGNGDVPPAYASLARSKGRVARAGN